MLVTICALLFKALVLFGVVVYPLVRLYTSWEQEWHCLPKYNPEDREILLANRAEKKFIVSPTCILLLVLLKASALAALAWYGQVELAWVSAMVCAFIYMHSVVISELYFPVWFFQPNPEVEEFNQNLRDIWGVLSPAARLGIAINRRDRQIVSTALGVDLTDDEKFYAVITNPDYEGMITV